MERGAIKVKGKICKKGKHYLEQEYVEPLRVLTSTVVVTDSIHGRLPVRTAKPIPKEKLLDCMEEINKIRVKPPIRIGDIILTNIADTHADIIACGEATE